MTSPDSLSPSSSAFDADALARQARFVRALARGLVRDDEGADELAARTIAAAVARDVDAKDGAVAVEVEPAEKK